MFCFMSCHGHGLVMALLCHVQSHIKKFDVCWPKAAIKGLTDIYLKNSVFIASASRIPPGRLRKTKAKELSVAKWLST